MLNNIEISTELLDIVLKDTNFNGVSFTNTKDYKVEDSFISINLLPSFNNDVYEHYISIDALASLCKKWINRQDYSVMSGYKQSNDTIGTCVLKKKKHSRKFISWSEPEAIFKAAEWVLNAIK